MRASAAGNVGSGSDNTNRNAGSPIHSDRRSSGGNRDTGMLYGGEGGQYHHNRNNFQHQNPQQQHNPQEQPSQQQQHQNQHQPLPASSTRDEQHWHTGSPQLPGFARNVDGAGSGGDGGDDRDRKGHGYGPRDGRWVYCSCLSGRTFSRSDNLLKLKNLRPCPVDPFSARTLIAPYKNVKMDDTLVELVVRAPNVHVGDLGTGSLYIDCHVRVRTREQTHSRPSQINSSRIGAATLS